MSSFFRTAFRKAAPSLAVMKANPASTAMWAFPALVGGAWFIWPAVDQEWLIELGLAKEPDLHIKAVQAAKDARMAAKKQAAPAAKEEEEEEEEDEPAAAAEEEEAAADEEPAVDEEPAAEAEKEEESGGDDDDDEDDDGGDEEEEEDESALPKFAPLLEKSEGKTLEEAWDNFTLKSIRTAEDDDDDDEDDDDDDDDDE